jgi:hypothetical protein
MAMKEMKVAIGSVLSPKRQVLFVSPVASTWAQSSPSASWGHFLTKNATILPVATFDKI